MTNQSAEANFSVNATTRKLPTFWTHQVAFWFRQAEIQFALQPKVSSGREDAIRFDSSFFFFAVPTRLAGKINIRFVLIFNV